MNFRRASVQVLRRLRRPADGFSSAWRTAIAAAPDLSRVVAVVVVGQGVKFPWKPLALESWGSMEVLEHPWRPWLEVSLEFIEVSETHRSPGESLEVFGQPWLEVSLEVLGSPWRWKSLALEVLGS